MKKLLIVSGIILSFSAVNLFASELSGSGSQAQTLSASTLNSDTTPKKRDTTSRKKDSASFAFNKAVLDTVPKKDTTKRKDTSALALNLRK